MFQHDKQIENHEINDNINILKDINILKIKIKIKINNVITSFSHKMTMPCKLI